MPVQYYDWEGRLCRLQWTEGPLALTSEVWVPGDGYKTLPAFVLAEEAQPISPKHATAWLMELRQGNA